MLQDEFHEEGAEAAEEGSEFVGLCTLAQDYINRVWFAVVSHIFAFMA